MMMEAASTSDQTTQHNIPKDKQASLGKQKFYKMQKNQLNFK
jgi:hypothetical protein